jgi:hypothetical protein
MRRPRQTPLVTRPSNEPSSLPSRGPGDAGQLGLLLDAAKDMLGEEIRRTDRLETRSRHMITACGALFAVAMATTAGILNALLNAENGDLAGWVVPVVGGTAIVSLLGLLVAIGFTWQVQRLRGTNALPADTIDAYITWAEKGHVAVAKNLITSYADALRTRRTKNDDRAHGLKWATWACAFSAAASVSQLGAAIVALLLR